MRSHSYINTAAAIIEAYNGAEPFAPYLKTFFSKDKKYGSRDRKAIGHLCYCYFRMGKGAGLGTMQDKLLLATFLCSSQSQLVLKELKPEWDEQVALPLEEKLSIVGEQIDVEKIFPFSDHLSKEIDAAAFGLSHLVQPLLYLRIRRGWEARVVKLLEEAGLAYQRMGESAIALPNGTKIEELVKLNREAVVQDISSQEVLQSLLAAPPVRLHRVWDCCAASGGKSILAYDTWKDIQLTVTDVRSSILYNLKNRFREGGINHFHSFVADLSKDDYHYEEEFDLVICDAPCSGSGTWSRTPEQLLFFTEDKITHYTQLQRSISVNAARSVKKGGYLLYITCSVFREENEDAVAQILANTMLQLVSQTYHKGYERKADTLFSALFQL